MHIVLPNLTLPTMHPCLNCSASQLGQANDVNSTTNACPFIPPASRFHYCLYQADRLFISTRSTRHFDSTYPPSQIDQLGILFWLDLSSTSTLVNLIKCEISTSSNQSTLHDPPSQLYQDFISTSCTPKTMYLHST